MADKKIVNPYIQWAADCPACGKTVLLDCTKDNIPTTCDECGLEYIIVWEEL